ncbi:MAG: hypothetical protein PUG75_06870 [Prevotella sp.]|nr:hypothetical protein [Prevotella sp.]
METFRDLRELIRWLGRGQTLIADMFSKRKTIAIRYDDAVETLDGNEQILQYLIRHGVIIQNAESLELDDAYQTFFENVLDINEDINVASVEQYVKTLKLNINSWLATDSDKRKAQFMRAIRHTFRNIDLVTRKNVIDLKRNIDITFKQEPDFKVKKLRLNDFDEKRQQIVSLISETNKIIDQQTIFFKTAMDVDLMMTVNDVRMGLRETTHGLIAIGAQIIDYLNRIDYQSRIVRKIRQLKYMRDQQMLADSTDIEQVLGAVNDVWLEPRNRYRTFVSLDFLRNEDSAIDILQHVRRRLSKKTIIRSRLAGKIDDNYLHTATDVQHIFNHRELINSFLAQSADLFTFIWNYPFHAATTEEERLVLFLQLASQYDRDERFEQQTETVAIGNRTILYPVIYPK